MRDLKRKLWVLVALVSGVIIAIEGGSLHYHTTPTIFVVNLLRVASAPLFAKIHEQDTEYVKQQIKKYIHGMSDVDRRSTPKKSWEVISRELPGFSTSMAKNNDINKDIPFIYQKPNGDYLVELCKKYHIDEFAEARATEYAKIIKIANWVGTRWDHGTDMPPCGENHCRPAFLVATAETGSKYNCYFAAQLMIHAASALGWPARMVTASKDGYIWNHALVEVWSNQLNKWFLIDTDYNIIYKSSGIPLSAFELCHDGPRLQKDGRLQIVGFAPLKPSLKITDLLPLYRYVHIDMRNDWLTRKLVGGSPAGGDLSTWWTARPDLNVLLTSRIHIKNKFKFNWKINTIKIYCLGVAIDADGSRFLKIGLLGYSPYFISFKYNIDNGAWILDKDGLFLIPLKHGRHQLFAAILGYGGNIGPRYSIEYRYAP
jgi:Transglutaminase-like superfamily